MSRRGSVPFGAFSRNVGVEPVAKPKESGPSPKELKEAASLAHANEATKVIKEQIKISLQEYADLVSVDFLSQSPRRPRADPRLSSSRRATTSCALPSAVCSRTRRWTFHHSSWLG